MIHIQLFITLEERTTLYMDVDMPFLYDGAAIEPGTYPINNIHDGYAHILGQGLIRLTNDMLFTCPHYTQDDYGYCHWHSSCLNNLCYESCIFNARSETVPTTI